ncbi:molybdopterin-binding oxidoreductase [Psychromonas hadalis]|uniref:molybdopterin-binding oxidoreductase n=1 Tax=Psychromonas hadalis TaxID=211669 RepID=UPI0003B679FC|nr:molybdopterin-binding oxidoreductase [Psychromonas hadalis]
MKISLLSLLLFLAHSLFASEKVLLNIHSVSQSVNEFYTLKQLQKLPQHEIKITIPWTDEEHIYKGPYLEDVFSSAGIEGRWLTLYALDHYQVSFNYQRIKKYNPILGLQIDGELLTIRSKGPIWLILPVNEYKELEAAVYNDYMVWQLIKINSEDKENSVH